ncbi:hypothetical protein GCG54_00003561 [Colletotrichum gloeosporioides]|uniref:Uncharacterized protein n=1 Tax=Colletotrichum gloeosporioides TaxID=474922 RepID=A0A8H4CBD6_COLGL|nr:uncharacterized protein GCG54_00003561 [Colletotrichum gloeosporioides]KAF3800663.1 hypothetical protein GCG54_00003561 [Colletotrichum gloeosporioides]
MRCYCFAANLQSLETGSGKYLWEKVELVMVSVRVVCWRGSGGAHLLSCASSLIIFIIRRWTILIYCLIFLGGFILLLQRNGVYKHLRDIGECWAVGSLAPCLGALFREHILETLCCFWGAGMTR